MPTYQGTQSPENFDSTEYTANLRLLAQQRGSKLRNLVSNDSHTGEAATVDQVGEAEVETKDGRHTKTPHNPIDTDRRFVYPETVHTATPIDTSDLAESLSDPRGKYVMAQGMALGRTIDSKIITAGLGTARKGKSGATSVALPNSQKIVAGGVGLTADKLRKAKNKFLANDVDLDIEQLFGAISPDQLETLEQSVEYGSADYNALRPLMDGKPVPFLGITLMVSTRLPGAPKGVNPGTSQSAMLWVPSGVHFGLWEDITSRIDELPTQSYDWQIYSKMIVGATRLEETKVVQIDTDHS
jgi:hypothetical protein